MKLKPKPKKLLVSVRVDEDLVRELKAIAKQNKLNVSQTINQVLRIALNK